MKIVIYATDLSIILGYNTYKNVSDIFLKIYQKHFPLEFNKIVKKMQSEGFQMIANKTSEETIAEAKLDVQACKDSKTATELSANKSALLKSVNAKADLSDEKKREITDAIHRVGNTTFGIRNENGMLDEYCKIYEKKIKPMPGFKFKSAAPDIKGKNEWRFGGKIDAITDDGIIIEIKNRVNKLFKTLRDYERVQLQTYLHLFDAKIGHLVEGIIKKDGSISMNVIEDKFSEALWKDLMKDFQIFVDVFEKSIADDNFMISFLKESPEIRNAMLAKLVDEKKQ